MDYTELTKQELEIHSCLYPKGYAIMVELLRRLDAQSAVAIESREICENLTAWRGLVKAVDTLLTGLMECDGHLDRVCNAMQEAGVYNRLLARITMSEFTDALAMALIEFQIPVRPEYVGWARPTTKDLEAQWATEPFTGEAGDNATEV